MDQEKHDIFLSYSRDDIERVQPLCELLVAEGFSVFWDRNIPPGMGWGDYIEEKLETATAVIVVWSESAINSEWVKEEAHEAKHSNKYFPVMIDSVRLPMGFRMAHSADLVTWQYKKDHQQFSILLQSLRQVIPLVEDQQPTQTAINSIKKSESNSPVPLPEFVEIPAGDFMMGDKHSSFKDEKPVHRVIISQAFLMSAHAITFDQFDAYTNATGKEFAIDKRGWGRDHRPVIYVSWHDAIGYTQWLSNQTGMTCRLPSEAEWEYAARAGTTTEYFWGDEVGNNHANFSQSGSQWSGQQTAPVGSFKANAFGLHDMHGNVWEWVQDTWHDNYKGAPDDGSAWISQDAKDDTKRVVRGGSWGHASVSARSAGRGRYAPGGRGYDVGFRVVCVPHD